ncbi:MAG: DNA repair protein RecN [Candidatus Aureabacteria bacterium]|nr:DNA repair protein RecN [Candidatus Auribacterota bacterium]
MIETIKINNIALAKDIEIRFGGGLNVMTGETGAGKSLLLSSLMLAMGEKWDKNYLRKGESKGSVSTSIKINSLCAGRLKLDELGLQSEESYIYIKRDFNSEGRNKVFINYNPVPISILKQIGDHILDYHSQNSHQLLLRNDYQMELLDIYGMIDKTKYMKIYGDFTAARRKLDEMAARGKISDELAELYQHQLNEISKASLKSGEESALEKELSVITNYSALAELSQEALNMLYDGDESIFNKLAQALKILCKIEDISGEKFNSKDVESFKNFLIETASEIRSLTENPDFDENRQKQVENRLQDIYTIKKKYGPQIADVEQKRGFLSDELRLYKSFEEEKRKLAAETAAIEEKLRMEGKNLSKKRKAAAKRLSESAIAELGEIGLEHARITISLSDKELGENGTDSVQYLFSANKGENPLPLKDVASGGEISRLMLALKTVFAGKDLTPVLIFDEIDTNIGGKTAVAVGRKLKELSKSHQVICITHLPQIAVMADNHFYIYKDIEKERTFTRIKKLDYNEKVEEIARMLGGKNITSVTLEHAKELLKLSGNT